jgi:hypothetical protein
MKGRKHRETGGANEAKEDEDTKPMRYTADSNVEKEGEERKRGGRAKRKRGGKTEIGKVEGHAGMHHAGRKPRASGGEAEKHEAAAGRKYNRSEEHREHEREGEEHRKHRARGGSTSDANPFTSARKGDDPPGRKVMKGDLGFGED